MPNKKYIVDLTEAQWTELLALTIKGTVHARKMKGAPIVARVFVADTSLVTSAAVFKEHVCRK